VEDGLVIDLRTDPPTLVISEVEREPLVSDQPSWRQRVTVRLFDLLIAIPAFVLTLPLVLLLMIAVRIDSPGPALFASPRITRNGRPFRMWKLRTMLPDSDRILAAHFREHPEEAAKFAASMKLENDPRVTRLGPFLRQWSLDELPQLLNVILGHMSIVGPRPLLADEAERMGAAYGTVVRVKGGMTGLWQVSGRSTLTFEQRVPLDVTYVNQRNVRTDLRIIGITVVQFVRGRPGAF
jgi:lipopolysaccharide/colanic/teichoic acid biosynthesis glycosyltransferase